MRRLALAAAGIGLLAGAARTPRIFFSHRPLAATLEHGETPRRYAPESMAGGVAILDYDGDRNLDLYFANGAEMPELRKTSPKYWNRLLRGDGKGAFTDVTEKAAVAGTG
jgi:hypothetical protein